MGCGQAAMAGRDLGFVLDPAFLKKIWKKSLRKALRSARLKESILPHDPLEYLAFDWDLEGVIDGLIKDVQKGTYRASAPEIIRSAKSKGLSRPLSFFELRDLLLFKAIALASQESLLRRSKPWTNYGRAGEKGGESDLTDEYSWFFWWLKRNEHLHKLVTTNDFIIETDVANFFPYVSVEAVAAHLHAHSNLGDDVVRVLAHMLSEFAQLPQYRPSAAGGLPQDSFDCSRVIAHTYLLPVDEAFEIEGEKGRYSRFVDDIVIGASTYRQGLRLVKKVQLAMEALGLYPNTAKTVIIRSSELEAEWLRSENDFVGNVEWALKKAYSVDLQQFRTRLRGFLDDENAKGKRAWPQVVKRYCTVSRILEDRTLYGRAFDLVEETPSLARNVFDYMAAFPLTAEVLDRIKNFSMATTGLYDDLDLILHEYICLAPNDDSDKIRSAIGEWALELVKRNYERSPRRAAAAAMTLGKFGLEDHFIDLKAVFDRYQSFESPARQQATIVLAATNHLPVLDLLDLVPDASSESARHFRYLSSLRKGDKQAVAMALAVVQPLEKRGPDHWVVRPRALFLAPFLRQGSPVRWRAASAGWRSKVQGVPLRFRDRAAERWLCF